ncbi:thiopurine S-methyltransferase [Spirosoma sp.]|uniref:thiopurine S-methyltransferase n=1 Tax=Spirosoma sp. TaxID=1899569 RepID=UPI003B3A2EAC
MEEIFWFNSWEVNRNHPGFFRQDIHPYIIKYLTPFSLEGKSVFVPLCGKSLDLLYFSHFAFRVVGVEISERTVQQFFAETKRSYKRIGNRFISGNLTIFCCDFFGLTSADLGAIDVVYDRASLAALPPSLRMRYRQVLEQLTPVGALNFLNTPEYDAVKSAGVLSGMAHDAVASYYPNYVIDHVERPTVSNQETLRSRSLPQEHAFLMHKLYDTTTLEALN